MTLSAGPMTMKQTNISWKQVENISDKLVEMIKDKKYDVVIGINRGGIVASMLISQKTKIRHGVTTIESYQGKRRTNRFKKCFHVSMIGRLNARKKILLVDDISDTGKSLREIVKMLVDLGCKENKIDTATLHYKQRSIFIPTFYGKKVSDEAWINYPWEQYGLK